MSMSYPIIAPAQLIELINERILDGNGIDELEELFPGVSGAIYRLNKRVRVHPPSSKEEDEGFSGWVYYLDETTGEFCVEVDQPHYLKSKKKDTFRYDGRKFVQK